MEEKEYCRSAVHLAHFGAFASLFIPSIGFSLAVCCLIVNHMERKYYDTGRGLRAGILSMIWAVLNWLAGAAAVGFI